MLTSLISFLYSGTKTGSNGFFLSDTGVVECYSKQWGVGCVAWSCGTLFSTPSHKVPQLHTTQSVL